jgi:hypothetical protein
MAKTTKSPKATKSSKTTKSVETKQVEQQKPVETKPQESVEEQPQTVEGILNGTISIIGSNLLDKKDKEDVLKAPKGQKRVFSFHLYDENHNKVVFQGKARPSQKGGLTASVMLRGINVVSSLVSDTEKSKKVETKEDKANLTKSLL